MAARSSLMPVPSCAEVTSTPGNAPGHFVSAASVSAARSGEDHHRRERQQLRLFEGFPKGLRLRPGMRYQEAAFLDPAPRSGEP